MSFLIKMICLLFLLAVLVVLPLSAAKMDFWSVQRKGANGALHKFRSEWFQAASNLGLEYIRFAPDNLPAAAKDFLIGNADNFTAINETDFILLQEILDTAHDHNLKIVLVMYSLPGCRWKQLNNDIDDYRIWQDEAFQKQAFSFWQQLALRLKDHPAIVGYNPLNEPHPGRAFGYEEANDNFIDWLHNSKGTAADLNLFNHRMITAIRAVDPDTPIILDGYFYADATGMPFIEPADDPNVLYSFHNIAPWQFAAFRINNGRYSYPDKMPNYWNSPGVRWTFDDLLARVDPVVEFASNHKFPANRIIAGEFWCDRRVSGCREYLADTIRIYNERGWHWAFYDFRSDGAWGGLDYELGAEPLGWIYWEAVERGEDPEPHKNRHDNPIWEVIKREFK